MSAQGAAETFQDAIQILVVDDSAVIRGLISRTLREESDFIVVDTAVNGLDAIAKLKANPSIEVVVLDIEMPEMDGLSALPELLKAVPDVKVLMASTLTTRNADISMKALELGAVDYVPKPSMKEQDSLPQFYHDLVSKVRALGLSTKRERTIRVMPASPAMGSQVAMPVSAARVPAPVTAEVDIIYPKSAPAAIAIASSTGGPQALNQLFTLLQDTKIDLPIFITQHMPPTFTTLLAKNISKAGGREVKEAEEGETVRKGVVYIAPGDYHMVVKKDGATETIHITQEPPVNYCRPAADPMIDSLSALYGSKLLVLVLTGMGHDGRDGAQRAVEKGATLVAQDEASSVVWGMPGAVANLNICAALLTVDGIASYIQKVGSR